MSGTVVCRNPTNSVVPDGQTGVQSFDRPDPDPMHGPYREQRKHYPAPLRFRGPCRYPSTRRTLTLGAFTEKPKTLISYAPRTPQPHVPRPVTRHATPRRLQAPSAPTG
ncbi:hypothetical protein Aca07nite_65860 [Actinoplanes capillaceus]|uniref:Uncharacterized protein n=1 Tax=Actinoplanes campanulatus TaxID=113559 RepID=A0ABQ3WSP5_9ACTN|nr:hypothetical protein Aca07nite_65860 [Actinoplanes capillaceus]